MSKSRNRRKTGKAVQRTSGGYNDVLSGVVELLDAARRASARVVNSLNPGSESQKKDMEVIKR